MATYLELTNNSIQEAGVSLASLTAGNFATTTDPLAIRFKKWVKDSYRELQQAREDWFWRKAEGVRAISPRIEFYKGFTTSGTLTEFGSGLVFALNSNPGAVNKTFKLRGTAANCVDIISGTFGTESAEGFMDIADEDGTNYAVTLIPTPGSYIVEETDNGANLYFYTKGWGSWGLSGTSDSFASQYDETISDKEYITPDKILCGEKPSQTATGADPQVQPDYQWELSFVTWPAWVEYRYNLVHSPGRPVYWTIDPVGRVRLYPHPAREFILNFYYTKTVETLSAHGDTPTILPSQYHDILQWMAVKKWAEYDKQYDDIQRARGEIASLRMQMERNEMPAIQMTPMRLW